MSNFTVRPEPVPWIACMLTEFTSALRAEGKPDTTVNAYVSDVTRFLEYLDEQDVEVETLTPRQATLHAADWLNTYKGTVSPATTQRRRSSVKAYFRLRLDMDVLTKYKPPSVPPGRAHPLPGLLDDVRKMLDHSRRRTRMAIALMGFAGLRVSEVRDLTWRHVEQTMLVVVGKGSKIRYVPIAPELRVEIDRYVHGMTPDPDARFIEMTDTGLRQSVTHVGELAGISRPVASHDLRMTFGTVVYNKTKDLRLVQDLLGHSDPKTTERYTAVSQKYKMTVIQGGLI